MISLKLLLLAVGMAIVTYLPRMLPLVFLHQVSYPPFLQNMLRYMPYAILGALIFPGILSSTSEENVIPALIAGIGCSLLAWFRLPTIWVVLAGILLVYLQTI